MEKVSPAGRWLQYFRSHLSDLAYAPERFVTESTMGHDDSRISALALLNIVDSPELKRLKVSIKSVSELRLEMFQNIQMPVMLPFNSMWIEFVEEDIQVPMAMPMDGVEPEGVEDYIRGILIHLEPIQVGGARLLTICVLLSDLDHTAEADSMFYYSLDLLRPLKIDTERLRDSTMFDIKGAVEILDWPDENTDIEDRYRWMMGLLITSLLVYICNAGTHFTEVRDIHNEGMTRQQRRRAQRKGDIPKPFHVVEVKPTYAIINGSEGDPREPTSTGTRSGYSYQFDVRGHWRKTYYRSCPSCGKTHRKFKHVKVTSSWVKPHKKGEGDYIPSTWLFEGDQAIELELEGNEHEL